MILKLCAIQSALLAADEACVRLQKVTGNKMTDFITKRVFDTLRDLDRLRSFSKPN